MLKLTYIKAMKISIIHSQQSLPFSSIKMLCTKNLTIRFGYNLRFKEWLLDFAERVGKVKKKNN